MPKFGNHIKQGLTKFGSFTHGFNYRVQQPSGKILASRTESEEPLLRLGKIPVTIKQNTLSQQGKQVLESQGAILYEGTVATRALRDMLEGKLASYEVKLYIQDNNLCWVDFTDRASVNGRNTLLKLGSMVYTAERLRGELQQNLSSIVMDNSDGFWDKVFPSSLKATLDESYKPIEPVTAVFTKTHGNQLSSIYRKKVSIRISYTLTGDLHPNTLTLGVFFIEDFSSDYKAKTTTIRLSQLNQPLLETPANKIKNGTSWYRNASADLLVNRILSHVYKEIPSNWQIDTVNNVKVPKAYSNGWAVSDFGKPKERYIASNSPNATVQYTFPNDRATAIKEWEYTVGTVNINIDSNTVTGVGTSWSTDIDTVGFANAIKVGDSLIISPEYKDGDGGSAQNNDGYYIITEINEIDQTLTLHKPFEGVVSESGINYTIGRLYIGVGSELVEYHIAGDYYEKIVDISESTDSVPVSGKRIHKIFFSDNLSTGTDHYPITVVAVSEPQINFNDWDDEDYNEIIKDSSSYYGLWGANGYNHGTDWYNKSAVPLLIDANGYGNYTNVVLSAQKAWQLIDSYNTTRTHKASWVNIKVTQNGPSDWGYDTISSYVHNQNVSIANGTSWGIEGDQNSDKYGLPTWELDDTSFVAFRGKDPLITRSGTLLPGTNDGTEEYDNIHALVMTNELPINLGQIKRASNYVERSGNDNNARAFIGGEYDLGLFIPFKQTVLSLSGNTLGGTQKITGTRFFLRDKEKYIFNLTYTKDPDNSTKETRYSISETNNTITDTLGNSEAVAAVVNDSIGSTPITFGNSDNTFLADWYKVSAVLEKGYYDASRSSNRDVQNLNPTQTDHDYAARMVLEYSHGGRGVLEKLEGWDYSNQNNQNFDLYFAIGPGPVDTYNLITQGGQIAKNLQESLTDFWELGSWQKHTPRMRYHWYLILNYRPFEGLNFNQQFVNPEYTNKTFNQVKFFDFDVLNNTNSTTYGRVIPLDSSSDQLHKRYQDWIPCCSTVDKDGNIYVEFVKLGGTGKTNGNNGYTAIDEEMALIRKRVKISIRSDADLIDGDAFGIKRDAIQYEITDDLTQVQYEDKYVTNVGRKLQDFAINAPDGGPVHTDTLSPEVTFDKTNMYDDILIPYEITYTHQDSYDFFATACWRPQAIGGAVSTLPSHVIISNLKGGTGEEYVGYGSNDFIQGLQFTDFEDVSYTNANNTQNPRITFWESSKRIMKSVSPAASAGEIEGNDVRILTDTSEIAVDKYQFVRPAYFSKAREFYWLGSDMPHNIYLSDGDGNYNLTKFSPRAAVRVDMADFSSISCWEALGYIAELANCRYGFYPNGTFFFKKKPRSKNSEFTFTNNGTNGLVSNVNKNSGLSMISNVISKSPSFLRVNDATLNVSLSPNSEYSKTLYDKNGEEIDQSVRHNIELVTSVNRDLRIVLVCSRGGKVPESESNIDSSDSVKFVYQIAKKFIETTLENAYTTPGDYKLPMQEQSEVLLASEIIVTGYSQVLKSDPDVNDYYLNFYSQVGLQMQINENLRLDGAIDDTQHRIQIKDGATNPADLSNVLTNLGDKLKVGSTICLYDSVNDNIEYMVVSGIENAGGNSNNTIVVSRGVYEGYPSVSFPTDTEIYLIQQDNNIIMNSPLTDDGDKIFEEGSDVKIAVPYARNSFELTDDPFSLPSASGGSKALEEYTPVLGQISWVGGKQGAYSTGAGIIFTAQSLKANNASNHRFVEGDRILIESRGPELVKDAGNIQTSRDVDSISLYGLKESTRNSANPFYNATQAYWSSQQELAEYSKPKYTFTIDTLFTPWINMDSIVTLESEHVLPNAKKFSVDCYITSMQFDPMARAMVRLTLRSVDPF